MQHSEASTAEILGIIKRVIERENREVAADEKRKRRSMSFTTSLHAPAPAESDDSPVTPEASDEVLDLGEAEVMIDGERPPEAADSAEAEPVVEPEPLTSNAARQSVNDSFAALAMLASGDAGHADAPGGSPLEGMVREMLRPMLAEWLDTNLPAIVEQLVREEIDRIAGKSR
ncbi:DUF2497 domain-containing protein [Aurantiacibacter xanthus]|uniref:DUF2497 domain-containing protein n=1 Tax=Aurantiacibacter xanthus TaxID=1784712 RepID=A0A3A1PH90_9SPHN|nr:DUF2497 domain-containing protein [Aurantiacibacter xanthus]RIV92325.1 DUF2497 domain-containing protein [Aurantiacibacter xanthus]